MSDRRLTKLDLGNTQFPRYLVVEGPIGAGKTTLCRLLAETFECKLMLEDAEANPFLDRFYAGEDNAALATQLFFLMQRSQQIQQLQQNDLFHNVCVADFLMDKDKLFAQTTLNEDELALYNQVYQHLTINAPKPDLVIYLQAPVEVLLKRIRHRGITREQAIQADYLQSLNEAYSRFFHYYEDSPLLIVNATDLDWVNRTSDYNDLVRYLLNVRSGRHYYNPHPGI